MLESDKSTGWRKTRLTMSGWLLLLFLGLLTPPSQAQLVDTNAPSIDVQELTDVAADNAQVFTVQVEEDNELQEVVLFYRRTGQLPYTAVPMQAVGATSYYSASIPTESQDLRTIEYYVKASDVSGNRTLSGFAFDPFRRILKKAAFTSQPSNSPGLADQTPRPQPAETQPLLQQRWVQITLGVLAVGVVASLASDSGGDERRIVPLTFNLR